MKKLSNNKVNVCGLTLMTVAKRLTRSRHAFGFNIDSKNETSYRVWCDVKGHEQEFQLNRISENWVSITSENYDLKEVSKLF